MLQSAAIDVAIALSLMYLMLSLLCTIVNEFIATKMKLRSKSLAAALQHLLDNGDLRSKFYQHGLVVSSMDTSATGPQSTLSGLASMVKSAPAPTQAGIVDQHAAAGAPAAAAAAKDVLTEHPSYLSGRTVALALIGSLDTTKPLPAIPDIQAAVQALPVSRIRDSLLSSLTEAGTDLDKLRTSVATWFDDAMERLSGAYKRRLKWISMLIGLIVAVSFNADTLNVASSLWSDPARRQLAVIAATKIAGQPLPGTPTDVDEAKLRAAIENTQKTLGSLPIGWTCVEDGVELDYWTCAQTKLPTVTVLQILGWLLTAAALSLGAPFWFDLLQKFVNVRGAGEKPKREDEK